MSGDAEVDARYMDEALALGRRGLGTAAPNPSVGAVLVKDGEIVGSGFTAPGGRPHGERIALDQAGDRARGATLYVTLEPCAHESHRGLSCTSGLIAAGVARVVSALEDPDPRTAGQGHAKLRAAGIAVDVGLRAEQARHTHLGHILRVTRGRPMVTLKLAMTADGYAAGLDHDPRLAITGEASNRRVHQMRAEHDAIMIGSGTLREDDPLLTVRLEGVTRKPLRVVLDSRLTLSLRSRIAATAHEFPTLVIGVESALDARASALVAAGIAVERVAEDAGGHVDLGAALQRLASLGVTRVFSEGGPQVGGRLIALRLADEVALFTGFKPLGRPGLPALSSESRAALAAPDRYVRSERDRYGRDEFELYLSQDFG